MKRGFTLVELLVTLFVSTIFIGSIGVAFSLGISFLNDQPDRLARFEDERATPTQLKSLFSGAYLSEDETDSLSYFTAPEEAAGTATTLTFTSLSVPQDGAYLAERGSDSQTLNERYGPQAGLAEVSLSTVPVGASAQGEGLFLRIQRPADGDPTQGGTERLLIEGATDVTYEFFDGTDWIATWDTQAGTGRRLPAAVRLTYSLPGESDPRTLILRLPLSDVTRDNPVTQGGTQ